MIILANLRFGTTQSRLGTRGHFSRRLGGRKTQPVKASLISCGTIFNRGWLGDPGLCQRPCVLIADHTGGHSPINHLTSSSNSPLASTNRPLESVGSYHSSLASSQQYTVQLRPSPIGQFGDQYGEGISSEFPFAFGGHKRGQSLPTHSLTLSYKAHHIRQTAIN